MIDKFVTGYNNFLDENGDMIEDPSTKEELHQRVDDLFDELSDIIQNRKTFTTEHVTKLSNSGIKPL